MYKITKKQNVFYVYRRFLFFFWVYEEIFGCLENAEQYVKFQKTKEETIQLK